MNKLLMTTERQEKIHSTKAKPDHETFRARYGQKTWCPHSTFTFIHKVKTTLENRSPCSETELRCAPQPANASALSAASVTPSSKSASRTRRKMMDDHVREATPAPNNSSHSRGSNIRKLLTHKSERGQLCTTPSRSKCTES